MSVVTVDYTAEYDQDEWAAWLGEYGIDITHTHHVEIAGDKATAYIYKINLEGQRFTDVYGDYVMKVQAFVPTWIPGYTVRPLSQ